MQYTLQLTDRHHELLAEIAKDCLPEVFYFVLPEGGRYFRFSHQRPDGSNTYIYKEQ